MLCFIETTAFFCVLSLLFTTAAADKNLASPNVLVLIITQKYKLHEDKAQALRNNLLNANKFVDVLIDTQDFIHHTGGWAIWPVIPSLVHNRESKPKADWLLILEEDTELNVENLLQFLTSRDPEKPALIGYGLRDQETTVIHHYAQVRKDYPFLYPDFAPGVLFSWPAVLKLNERISARATKDFTIDAKHELAMLLWEEGKGIALEHSDHFCLFESVEASSCVTQYRPFNSESCINKVTCDDILFGVKTFSGHHKTRIVVVKRTWAKQALNIEYYSDAVDNYIPTIDLGVPNTERGHCGKTMAIIHRFAENKLWQNKPWLVIADDDTLLSIPRLLKLLKCYNPTDRLIIGERYAYGLTSSGQGGYEYPTGGSGMIFSRPAAEALSKNCNCGQDDSPDDMILGMCARRLVIPLIHSPALHQARPPDYSEDYLKRIEPISFHKHWEIDPYKVYTNWLHVELPVADLKTKPKEEL